ncbi:MAG: hypothetical protein ACFFDI_14095 [Promethearchaeota archaeon]
MVEVDLDPETMAKLEQIANEARLSTPGVVALILSEFVDKPGGRIYVGSWRRGNVGEKKGFRLIVQWPFKTGFIKVKGDEMKKFK